MKELDETAERLRVALRLIMRRGRVMSGPDGPTSTETSVLGWLDERGPMTPSALSTAHNVRPQTMGQVIDLLASRGWVKRGPHPTDRRQILISLTPSGHRALARGRKVRQAWLAAEPRKLSPRDLQLLTSAVTILERFVANPTPPSNEPASN